MFKPRLLLVVLFLIGSSLTARADFLSGADSPASSLGANGDHYLATTSGMLYKKTSGTWTIIQNRLLVKGDRGAAGLRGPQGGTGPAGPRLRTAANATALAALIPNTMGEPVVRLDNKSIWIANSTTTGDYSQISTAGTTGPAGPAGAAGPTGPAGAAGAAGAPGTAGTFANGQLLKDSTGATVLSPNLRQMFMPNGTDAAIDFSDPQQVTFGPNDTTQISTYANTDYSQAGLYTATGTYSCSVEVNADGTNPGTPKTTITLNAQQLLITGIPSTNPLTLNSIWNDAGTLKVSAGP